MKAIYIDVDYLKDACGWGRYKTFRGRTKYGVLNVPNDIGKGEVLAYDFSPDRNGDISVNVRRVPRNLDRQFMERLADFRGFIISKNGFVRPLKESRANRQERGISRKGDDWHLFATFLKEYLDSYRGDEE